MSPKFYVTILILVISITFVSADIFGDLLGFDLVGAFTGDSEEKKAPSAGKREEENDEGSTCDCDGFGCNCCVDFNLTSILDLGGPGCVKMRYISKNEGIALNVSYGGSLLHSHTVKQNDKKGSCMNLLSEFAQICAKFSSLRPTADGLEGCLNFEPHVLGEVTDRYHIGCFKMGPEGMVQDQKLIETEESEDEKPATAEEEEADDQASILDVVNSGAEQGLAFFSDLLGIKVPGKKIKTTTGQPEEATEATSVDSESQEESVEESRLFRPVKNRLDKSRR